MSRYLIAFATCYLVALVSANEPQQQHTTLELDQLLNQQLSNSIDEIETIALAYPDMGEDYVEQEQKVLAAYQQLIRSVIDSHDQKVKLAALRLSLLKDLALLDDRQRYGDDFAPHRVVHLSRQELVRLMAELKNF